MQSFIQIESPHLRAEISPVGAALARVWYADHPTSLVLGLPTPEDYRNAPGAIGVVVGPIAGRVAHAKAPLGDKIYQMQANTPPDCLHSGTDGAQNQTWDISEQTASSVTLTLALPDGACGLPGNRTLTARYSIHEATLEICLECETDADTLINISSHAYWVLDDSGGLTRHELKLDTTRMAETSEALIPTGKILDCSGKDFDFSQGACPVDGPAVDGCFCLMDGPSETPRPVLNMQSKITGLQLDVSSTEPGVVLYTGSGLPTLETPPNTPAIQPFSAIAIEAQHWPDAPNHSNFPSIVLKKGRKSKQLTRFSVSRPKF